MAESSPPRSVRRQHQSTRKLCAESRALGGDARRVAACTRHLAVVKPTIRSIVLHSWKYKGKVVAKDKAREVHVQKSEGKKGEGSERVDVQQRHRVRRASRGDLRCESTTLVGPVSFRGVIRSVHTMDSSPLPEGDPAWHACNCFAVFPLLLAPRRGKRG